VELYERWCESTKEKNKRKYYWTYVEKDGGRDDIEPLSPSDRRSLVAFVAPESADRTARGDGGKIPRLAPTVHLVALCPKNFRSGAMAIAARSGPAFNGRHRRLGRRLADQCWQNAGCGDCCANDLVVRATGTDRHAIARIVRPDGAFLQKDLRASRLQRFLALRRQRPFGW